MIGDKDFFWLFVKVDSIEFFKKILSIFYFMFIVKIEFMLDR